MLKPKQPSFMTPANAPRLSRCCHRVAGRTAPAGPNDGVAALWISAVGREVHVKDDHQPHLAALRSQGHRLRQPGRLLRYCRVLRPGEEAGQWAVAIRGQIAEFGEAQGSLPTSDSPV